VARRQGDARDGVGMAEGLLQHGLALMADCERDARLLGQAHLEVDPLGDVVEGGGEPLFHGSWS
jgi:hypothetical protein